MNDQRASQFGGKNKLCEGIGYSFETDSWGNIRWGNPATLYASPDCENLPGPSAQGHGADVARHASWRDQEGNGDAYCQAGGAVGEAEEVAEKLEGPVIIITI